MFYLICNVLFASAFTLTIKWVHVRQREDIITVGPINYIVAALLIAPQFFTQVESPDPAAALCGAGMGACYFVAFFFVIYAIKHVGAASTTVVSSLSLLFPIAAAAVLWDEVPNTAQCIGIGLALVALSLVGTKGKRATSDEPSDSQARPWVIPAVLGTFFLLAGTSRLLQRTLDHVSSKDQLPTFLLAAFATASVPSIILLIERRKSIGTGEIGLGVLMGGSNILQSHFILKALGSYAGYIVFPISSAGGLILTTFVATRFMGEQLTSRKFVGIGLAVVALVLLNWLPT